MDFTLFVDLASFAGPNPWAIHADGPKDSAHKDKALLGHTNHKAGRGEAQKGGRPVSRISPPNLSTSPAPVTSSPSPRRTWSPRSESGERQFLLVFLGAPMLWRLTRLWIPDMKRAAPSEEPLDVSSGDSDSLSSDSDEDAAKIFGIPNTSKAAPANEGQHYSGDLLTSNLGFTLHLHVLLAVGCHIELYDF
jgi:hypothetical protein